MNKFINLSLIFCLVTASLDTHAGRHEHERYSLDMIVALAASMAASASRLFETSPVMEAEAPSSLEEALMSALFNYDTDLMRDILNTGLNPNFSTTEAKNTPLHIAAAEGHLEMVTLLVSRGADPSIRNADGQTALDNAIALLSRGKLANSSEEEFEKVIRFLEEFMVGGSDEVVPEPPPATPPPRTPSPPHSPIRPGSSTSMASRAGSAFHTTPPRNRGATRRTEGAPRTAPPLGRSISTSSSVFSGPQSPLFQQLVTGEGDNLPVLAIDVAAAEAIADTEATPEHRSLLTPPQPRSAAVRVLFDAAATDAGARATHEPAAEDGAAAAAAEDEGEAAADSPRATTGNPLATPQTAAADTLSPQMIRPVSMGSLFSAERATPRTRGMSASSGASSAVSLPRTPRTPSASEIRNQMIQLSPSTSFAQAKLALSMISKRHTAANIRRFIENNSDGVNISVALKQLRLAHAAARGAIQAFREDEGVSDNEFIEFYGALVIGPFNAFIEALEPFVAKAEAREAESADADGEATGGAHGGNRSASRSSSRARSRAESRSSSRPLSRKALAIIEANKAASAASTDSPSSSSAGSGSSGGRKSRSGRTSSAKNTSPRTPSIPTGASTTPLDIPDLATVAAGSLEQVAIEIETARPTQNILGHTFADLRTEIDQLFADPDKWVSENKSYLLAAFLNYGTTQHIGIMFADVLFADGHRAVYAVAANNANDGHTEQRAARAIEAQVEQDALEHGGHVTAMRAMWLIEREPCGRDDNDCSGFLQRFNDKYANILVENPAGSSIVWRHVGFKRKTPKTDTKVKATTSTPRRDYI